MTENPEIIPDNLIYMNDNKEPITLKLVTRI